MIEKGKWLRTINSCNSNQKLNLLCFPYAGSSASYFFGWKKLFLDYNLYAVKYPMREGRINDIMSSSIQEMAKCIVEENVDVFKNPFLLFGHSLGGIIAYEVACVCEQLLKKSPEVLFVSGSLPPMETKNIIKTSNLSNDNFLEIIKNYEGTPISLLQNQEFNEYYLPILRADFELLEKYNYPKVKKLNCNLVCFFGNKDKTVPTNVINQWDYYTNKSVEKYYFNGNHFFIDDKKEDISILIKESLAKKNKIIIK